MSVTLTPAEVQGLLARSGRVRNVAPKEARTYGGRVYHSKAEARYAFELDALKAAGRIKEWQPQITFPIVVKDVKVCAVVIDFEVMPPVGKPWYIEVKGMETEVYKLKRKLLKACYPTLDYRVVKA